MYVILYKFKHRGLNIERKNTTYLYVGLEVDHRKTRKIIGFNLNFRLNPVITQRKHGSFDKN